MAIAVVLGGMLCLCLIIGGFYYTGIRLGRSDAENDSAKDANEKLLKVKAIRDRLRYDADFAKRLRDRFRR